MLPTSQNNMPLAGVQLQEITMMKLIVLLTGIAVPLTGTLVARAHAAEKPCLILQITIDQLRGDLPTRYRERLTS